MTDYFTSQSLSGQKPSKVYEYYVSGYTHFPMDMLRYDQCWPVSPDDASNIGGHAYNRSIKMRSYSEPTVDRWKSFLWSVGTEKIY